MNQAVEGSLISRLMGVCPTENSGSASVDVAGSITPHFAWQQAGHQSQHVSFRQNSHLDDDSEDE